MTWSIEKISPEEDAVFLVNATTGIERKISVPGTQSASMNNNGRLYIKASTGFFWEVQPETGWRKRFSVNQVKDEPLDSIQLELLG